MCSRKSGVRPGQLVFFIALGAGILFIFLCPQQATAGVSKGLLLCYTSIIPSLFPFFVVSSLILNSLAARWMGLLLRPYTALLGYKRPSVATAVFLGLLGGFAIGGSAVGELYGRQEITARQASCLLCAAVNSGPAFIVNAVGFSMLGNAGSGFLLLGALLAATLVTGVICCRFAPGKNVPAGLETIQPPVQTPLPLPQLFVQAVGGAVRSTLLVCGYVVFFCFLSAALTCLPMPTNATMFISALLEVTTGCAACATAPWGLYLCAACLSIMGLSIFCQLRALLPNEVSLRPLLLSRLLHLPLTLLFLAGLTKAFPAASLAAALGEKLVTAHRMAPDAGVVAFLFCLLFVCEMHPDAIFTKKDR